MENSDLIPCSGCGDLIQTKGDDKYQKPMCSRCTSQKNSEKKLDKPKDSGMMTCGICGAKYAKNTDPYSRPTRCGRCYDEKGRLYWWKT